MKQQSMVWFVCLCRLQITRRGGEEDLLVKAPIRHLQIKIVVRCGDPKILADAMKHFPRSEYLNTRNCALEGSEVFGSTKWKLDLPPSTHGDSHWFDKVNYSIPRTNDLLKKACIKEFLNYAEHSVAHTTSNLETDNLTPTYKCLKKKFRFTNDVEYEFWTCHDDIKKCVKGNNKKKYGGLA